MSDDNEGLLEKLAQLIERKGAPSPGEQYIDINNIELTSPPATACESGQDIIPTIDVHDARYKATPEQLAKYKRNSGTQR